MTTESPLNNRKVPIHWVALCLPQADPGADTSPGDETGNQWKHCPVVSVAEGLNSCDDTIKSWYCDDASIVETLILLDGSGVVGVTGFGSLDNTGGGVSACPVRIFSTGDSGDCRPRLRAMHRLVVTIVGDGLFKLSTSKHTKRSTATKARVVPGSIKIVLRLTLN